MAELKTTQGWNTKERKKQGEMENTSERLFHQGMKRIKRATKIISCGNLKLSTALIHPLLEEICEKYGEMSHFYKTCKMCFAYIILTFFQLFVTSTKHVNPKTK